MTKLFCDVCGQQLEYTPSQQRDVHLPDDKSSTRAFRVRFFVSAVRASADATVTGDAINCDVCDDCCMHLTERAVEAIAKRGR